MLQKVKDKFFATQFGYYYWLLRTWPMRKKFPRINILSIEETIDKIVKERLSISRFGDGEFILLMRKRDIVFQKLSNAISDRLFEVINSNRTNHLVCLTSALTDRKNYTHYSKTYWINFLNRYSSDLMNKMIYHKNIYGNALISRFYLHRKNKENTFLVVEKLKKIWDKQDILFVEGELSRLGIGNDLFDNAKSIERIICPSENAFEKYDEILKKSLELGGNKLIIIALGPTATILSYDLSQHGIWALDLGHIDIEYSWFKMNATSRIPISGKKTAEISSQTNLELSPELKGEYERSIIYKISE